MGEHADIYVAVRTRSKEAAVKFLDHFLPNREQMADEFEFPQYSKSPENEFDNADDLMTYLEINEAAEYGLYWRNLDNSNPNLHGMLFYTIDKAIVFGISRDAENSGSSNTENEDDCLKQMKSYFKTDHGYITYEDMPYETIDEFERALKK